MTWPNLSGLYASSVSSSTTVDEAGTSAKCNVILRPFCRAFANASL